jgi:hypothetical protein
MVKTKFKPWLNEFYRRADNGIRRLWRRYAGRDRSIQTKRPSSFLDETAHGERRTPVFRPKIFSESLVF